MNKRWNRTIALLLVVLLLLSGCGTPQSTETTEEAPVGSVADVVDTDSNTTFLDFCRTTDGYAVLARTASGVEISELDAGLHEAEKNQVDIGEAVAIAEGGGHRWIVVMSEGSKVEILCDESTWLQTGISGYLYQSQLVWEQDTLYSVLNRSLWIRPDKGGAAGGWLWETIPGLLRCEGRQSIVCSCNSEFGRRSRWSMALSH